MSRVNVTHVIAERDGWICNGCGKQVEVWNESDPPERWATIDHKEPDGGDDPKNLWLLCNICNGAKGQQSYAEWMNSLDFDGSFLRRGFTMVPNTILENSGLSLGARMTLISLMSFAWRGDPFPGQKRLGAMLGCSERTIHTYLTELKSAGFLKVQRRGRGKTNVYRIVQTKILKLPPEEAAESAGVIEGRRDLDRKQASALDRKQASGEVDEVEADEGGEPSPTAQVPAVAADRAPKLTKIDSRDIAFDSLAETCAVANGSNRAREVGIALSGRGKTIGIRDQFWRELQARADRGFPVGAGESFEVALSAEVVLRAELYRTVMPGATLTPLALAKWWSDLPRMAQEQGRPFDMSPEAILAATREFDHDA